MNGSIHSWRRRTGIGIAIVGLLAAIVLPLRHDLGWIDPVTGSTKAEIRWFGLYSKTSIKTSAIEVWINRHENKHARQWRFLHDTSVTLLGHRRCACGLTPEIYDLVRDEWNDTFVRHSSGEEMQDFLNTMRSSDCAAKRKVVQAAVQKVFEVDAAAATSTP